MVKLKIDVLRKSYCLLLGVFITYSSLAQDDGNYEYDREFIWGINKNTNGGLIGGFIIKTSKAIDPYTFRTIGGEIMNVKHPKEDRKVSREEGRRGKIFVCLFFCLLLRMSIFIFIFIDWGGEKWGFY